VFSSVGLDKGADEGGTGAPERAHRYQIRLEYYTRPGNDMLLTQTAVQLKGGDSA